MEQSIWKFKSKGAHRKLGYVCGKHVSGGVWQLHESRKLTTSPTGSLLERTMERQLKRALMGS